MEMKIEKNIPMPVEGVKKHKYPFGEMEIGDSFYVDETITRNSVNGSMTYYGLKNNKKFSIKKEGNGYRIWRVK